MKWLTIRTPEYKKQQKSCWHYWFAWHPITIKIYPDGARERIWLCKVKRKGTHHCGYAGSYWLYEYKVIE